MVPAYAIKRTSNFLSDGIYDIYSISYHRYGSRQYLMAMGMMMLPPVMISLPFKILLFVLVDGWYLIVKSLLLSFNT